MSETKFDIKKFNNAYDNQKNEMKLKMKNKEQHLLDKYNKNAVHYKSLTINEEINNYIFSIGGLLNGNLIYIGSSLLFISLFVYFINWFIFDFQF